MRTLSKYEEIFTKIVKGYVDNYPGHSFQFYFDDLKYPRIGKSKKTITVRFTDAKDVFRRIFIQGSMGLGECYCEGLIDVADKDYKEFLFIFVRAMHDKRILKHVSIFDNLRVLKARGAGGFFTRKSQDKNINSHYSLSDWFSNTKDSNAFYLYWLDPKYVQYTSAKWDRDTKTVEQAQKNKMDFYAKRLGLDKDKRTKGKTVLDLGCGWGGFMFYLNKKYGLICKGMTLSTAQVAYIQEQIRKRKLQGKVSIEHKNAHDMSGEYDYVVSIGLLEHIDDYDDLYKKTARCLKKDGAALFHAMFHQGFYKPDPFFSKYIFPGGGTPNLDSNLKIFRRHFSYVDKHDFDTLCYPKTLDCWYRDFCKAEKKIRKLLKEKSRCKDVDYAIRVFKHYLVLASAGLTMHKNIRNILLKR